MPIFYEVATLDNPSEQPFALVRVDTDRPKETGVEGVVMSLHWTKDDAAEAAEINTMLGELSAMECKVEPCGSRVTCDPAPTDTDQDYLVQMPNRNGTISKAVSLLSGAGFRWEGGEHYQMAAGDFMSWRLGNINLIVTANANFAQRHRAATYVCKRLNLLNKQDRISLFQAVLYGNQWNGEAETAWQALPSIKEEEIAF